MSVRANTDGTTDARTAHVPPAVSHARAVEGDAVDAMRMTLAGLAGHQDMVARAEDDAFDAAVSAELVACTLGQRRHADRLELRTDLAGRVLQSIRSLKALVIP